MSYDSFETSVHDAAPIECYKFIGSNRTYRYTSADTEVTVNGEVYTPVASRRNAVKAGTHEDDTLSLELELPFDIAVVKDYAYAESPPNLTLEMYRVHRGTSYATDWSLLWKGIVSAFNVNGRRAKMRVPSVFARALAADVPSVYYQNPCNHVLYDGRCKVSSASFSSSQTVQTVGTTAFDLDAIPFADGVLAAGEMLIDRTGERRMILNNVATTVTVNHPYLDVKVGDTVTIYAGCDHSFTTCKNKFSNAANFGGHPFIPGDNPFEGELR